VPQGFDTRASLAAQPATLKPCSLLNQAQLKPVSLLNQRVGHRAAG
jgi:hypothetical protein